jgi:hypothetical protein
VDFREETTTAWECEPGKNFPCGIHIQLDLLDVVTDNMDVEVAGRLWKWNLQLDNVICRDGSK